MEVLREAVARASAGEPLALVTVIAVRGSAPRHVGTKMLVTAAGDSIATIGGGRVEFDVTRTAVEVARGGPARRVHHHLVRDLAMCCGGSMEFYIEPVAPSVDAIREVLARFEARVPTLLCTPLDGGAKTVAELPASSDLRFPARDGERFVEPIWPRERVILFGAGHVARALGPIAHGVGFEVVVCDDDETGAASEIADAPWAVAVVESFDVRDVEADVGALGRSDYALIMTRDHAVDQAILEQLVSRSSLAYLGLIGSRGKIARFHKRLRAKGVATDGDWARLHAPIGLDIGAETPEEIAVAVVAELVQVRRRGPRDRRAPETPEP